MALRTVLERLVSYQARSQAHDSRSQNTGQRWQVGRVSQIQINLNLLYFADIHLETEGAAGAEGLHKVRAFLSFLAHSGR